MIKASLKKLLLPLISTQFIGISIVLACAGGWYTINEATAYTPELFVDSSYSPFFYSYDFYYEIGHDDKQNDRFNATVVNDWYTYLDRKFENTEIETVLFKTTHASLDSILKSKVPARFSGLQITKSRDKKTSSFFNYLNIAKQAEAYALANEDDWNYYDDKPKKERRSSAAFCATILNAYKASKDNFIKQRYLFQLVRAFYFNKDYKSCVNVFESNATDFPQNTMYYRCMSYAAGAYKKSGNISQANYYYSLVFDKCNDLKTTAHFSFKPQEESDWKQTLALCKTDDEKCTLWQMLGVFYNDEQRSLEEIIKLNPQSDKCDLLLSRAVNKFENALFESGVYNEFLDNKNEDVKKRLKQLITFIETAATKNVAKPYQWHMALGYLQVLDNNHKQAAANFKLAEKSIDKTNTLLMAQLRTLNLINTIADIKTLDHATEEKLTGELVWFNNICKDEAMNKVRTNAVNSWIHKALNAKYKAQKEFLKAEFFAVDRSFYVDEKQLHDMQNFLLKTNKTPYESYCESMYTLTLKDLYEFEALNKTYNDDIDAAIALMEKAGKNGEVQLLSNPFNGGIKDCHDCDHALPQKTKFSKLSTLKKVKEMKSSLSTDTYNNALLLGNFYYNITFFGSSRVFYYGAIMDSESSSTDMMSTSYVYKLTDMTLAKKYYTKALKAATTDEQKAKCTYLLSKCERNEWYNNNGNKEGLDFIAFKNFVELKKYANTKYYKEIIAECGYFKKYVSR